MQLAAKVLLTSSFCFMYTLIFLFLFFHKFLALTIRYKTSLRKGHEVRDIYLKLPFPLETKIYIFNVTNPEEVTMGEKPILQEVGPIGYNLWVTKVNVTDNKTEDTLAYNPFDTYIYNSRLTNPKISLDDEVTILNPIIAGAAMHALATNPGLLRILGNAIDSVFRNASTMYVKAKVREVLFDGITIDCRVKDFAGGAMCSQLKTRLPGLKIVEPSVFKYSLLNARNATMRDRVKINRGIKHWKLKGTVVEFNGKTKLDTWADENCNRFKGTDGWIFPPFISKDEGIWTFSGESCRSIQMKFVKESHWRGLPTDLFEADIGDKGSDNCYCETKDKCLPKGLYDLSKCLEAPLIISLPHFNKVDERFLNHVVGLNPNDKKHALHVYFERMTGAPIEGYKRIQFNIYVKPVVEIIQMRNISECLHPIFWMEESASIPKKFRRRLKFLFKMIKLNKIFRWIFLIASFSGMVYSGFLFNYGDKLGLAKTKLFIQNIMNSSRANAFNFKSTSSAKSKENVIKVKSAPVINKGLDNMGYIRDQ